MLVLALPLPLPPQNLLQVVMAAGPPTWFWATLLVGVFAALSVLTIVLARFPAQRTPPALGQAAGEAAEGSWAVARLAPDQLTAEMWVALLRQEGVPALIKPSDAVSFLGTSSLGCRVLVPKERLEEAEALLDAKPAEETDGT